MARQLRIYTMKEGRLDEWVALWVDKIAPLRRGSGFDVTGYAVPEKSKFVWILDRSGSNEEFVAADAAYYEQPEHPPLHAKGLEYLAGAETFFLDPVE